MPVNGASARPMFHGPRGTINTDATFLTNTKEDPPDTFNPPVNILAFPILQSIGESSDQSSASVFVQEFTDAKGTHKGPMVGVASTSCTKIVWGMSTSNCFASGLRFIIFF